MRILTMFLRRAAAIAIVVLSFAGTAWAQFVQADGQDLFTARNGDAASCAVAADPCSLVTAFNAITSPGTRNVRDPMDITPPFNTMVETIYDTVWVRIREEGATARFDENFTVGSNGFVFATYSGSTSPSPSSGEIVIEGDVLFSGSPFVVAKGSTLRLESDEVTMRGPASGEGEVVLGGGPETLVLNLADGSFCSMNSFEKLSIADDVDVKSGACNDGSTNRLDIGFDLTVRSGATLDMGDVELHLVATVNFDFTYDASTDLYDRTDILGTTLVEAGAAIVGKELFVLNPIRENVNYNATSPEIIISDTLETGVYPFSTTCRLNDWFPYRCGVVSGGPQEGDFGRVIETPVPGSAETKVKLIYFGYGYYNSPDLCYEITGGGSIRMDMLKVSQAGVCISVPRVGNGGTITNTAGALYFKETTSLDGTFRNLGRARTEFWALETLTEDLEISGTGSDHPHNAINAAKPTNFAGLVGDDRLPEASPLMNTQCDGEGQTGRASGVYVFSELRILGGIILDDTDSKDEMEPLSSNGLGTRYGTKCKEGLHFLADNFPEDDDNFRTLPGGIPTETSTVFGPAEIVGQSFVNLDYWNKFHNIAFEEDIYVENDSAFTTVIPAISRTYHGSNNGLRIFPNVCGYHGPREELGNKVVLRGDLDQDVRFSSVVTFDALQIDKSNADVTVTLTTGDTLWVRSLELRSGELVTNGKLDMKESEMESTFFTKYPEASISKGTAGLAYTGHQSLPSRIRYTGAGDDTAGDEVYSPFEDGSLTRVFTVEWMQIWKPDDATVTTNEPMGVRSLLDLHSGTLEVGEDNALLLGRNVWVEYGSGDVSGPGDVIFVPGTDYDPGQHGLTLTYYGAQDRDAGYLWPSSATAPGPNIITNVDVDGANWCSASPNIRLNPGYSRFDHYLQIYNGSLDLAGQHLVAHAVSGNKTNNIIIYKDGNLCDSSAGVSCGGGGAGSEAGERGRRDFTEEDKYATRDRSDASLVAMPVAGDESMVIRNAQRKVPYEAPTGIPEWTLATNIIDAIDEAKKVVSATGSRVAVDELGDQLQALRSSQVSVAKTSRTGGALHFIGNGSSWLNVETYERKILPSIIVERWVNRDQGNGAMHVRGLKRQPETGTNEGANLDIVAITDVTIEHGLLVISDSLDVLHVLSDLTLRPYGGLFFDEVAADLNPADSLGNRAFGPIPQTIKVGTDNTAALFRHTGGLVRVYGGVLSVYGDFVMEAEFDGTPTFYLNGGSHTVTGDFHVGPNPSEELTPGDEDVRTVYKHDAGCAGTFVAADATGSTTVMGDYRFEGTGDCYADDQYSAAEQGLSGNVTFMGDSTQTIMHRQDPDSYFGSVTLHSTSDDPSKAFVFDGPVVQNIYGTLTLKRGVVAPSSSGTPWIMHNTGSEEDLAGRNTATIGTVMLGSRDSYFKGGITRPVAEGFAGGGVVTGGYLFPVGIAEADSTTARVADSFRPIILQFPDDLGITTKVTVDYVQQLSADLVQWPDAGIVVDGYGGGTLTLDAVADQFWLVTFDNIPGQDPNIRVEAEGLPNVFDARGLRLVQWDCDLANPGVPTNPRLAGVYDLEDDGTGIDDGSYASNDRINGVLNLTQEGVRVGRCNIFGIASNFLQNPVNMPPVSGGFAQVQYVQNVANTTVDVYMDGNRILNDQVFQSATQFVNVAGGEHTIEVVAAGDADNSSPLASVTARFMHEGRYDVIVHGDATEATVKVVDGVRMSARDENSVEFFIVHGARELGAVDIRLLNPINNVDVLGAPLANNLDWDDVGKYIRLEPGAHNVEVTTSNNDRQIDVFHLELEEYSQQTFVLNLSGQGKSSAEGLTLLGVEQDGSTFFPMVITAAETEEELPTEFELKGNYPNPFNPSTNIQIDLPEAAEVTVEIIDILGRNVMTVPAIELEAGAKRNVEVNGLRLASGTYLYRVIARSASGVNIDTGRMVLAK